MKKSILVCLLLFFSLENSLFATGDSDLNQRPMSYQIDVNASQPESYAINTDSFKPRKYMKEDLVAFPQRVLHGFSNKMNELGKLKEKHGVPNHHKGDYLNLSELEDPAYKLKDVTQLAQAYDKFYRELINVDAQLQFVVTGKNYAAEILRLKGLHEYNFKFVDKERKSFRFDRQEFLFELGKQKILNENQKKVLKEILKAAYQYSKENRQESDNAVIAEHELAKKKAKTKEEAAKMDASLAQIKAQWATWAPTIAIPSLNFASELSGAELKNLLQSIEKEIQAVLKEFAAGSTPLEVIGDEVYMGVTLKGKVTKEQIKEIHQYVQNNKIYGCLGISAKAASVKLFFEAIKE